MLAGLDTFEDKCAFLVGSGFLLVSGTERYLHVRRRLAIDAEYMPAQNCRRQELEAQSRKISGRADVQ